MNHRCIASPFGPLTVFEESRAVVAIDWGRPPESSSTPLLDEAARQLEAYFAGRLRAFDLPLKPAGTPFRRAVWDRLRDIPHGAVMTYGELAADLGTAPRAIGGACAANPVVIVIPCHRVVGADGAMTGFSAGQGVATKRALLELEGADISNPREEP